MKQNKDAWRMDIKSLEAMVGKEPVGVEVHNNHVVCTFDNNTRVLFRKW